VTTEPGERVEYRRERSGRIAAPPEAVWPWLVQMGYDRGGWYAIDRLEKVFGVGRFATGGSARRVEPSLQQLAVGDRLPLSRHLWLDVTVMDRPLILELVLPPGRLAWTWRFVLAPAGPLSAEGTGEHCDLTIVTELSVAARRPVVRWLIRLAFAAFDVGHGVMEHVQLRTLARRVPRAAPGAAHGAAPGDAQARGVRPRRSRGEQGGAGE